MCNQVLVLRSEVARLFEPGDYRLRIDSARIIQNKQNVSVVLSLIEMERGCRVDIRPLWVNGPNAGAGDLAGKNQHLIGQLLTSRGLPTKGDMGVLIPQLAGLEFDAHLVLDPDGRTGRTYNALDDIYSDDGP